MRLPGADPAIGALGLRNPWRASFDRLTGDLYIGNVGAHLAEEIEFEPFDSPGGANYGWSRLEGTAMGPHPGPATLADVFPFYENRHESDLTAGPGRSITGGYVYRGPIIALRGHYVFADFLGDFDFSSGIGSAHLFSFVPDRSISPSFAGTKVRPSEVLNRTEALRPNVGEIDFISSFGEDAAGNLYIVDMGNLGTPDGQGLGEIYKVCGVTETGDNGCR